MKRSIRLLLAGSGVLAVSIAAHAQYYPQRDDPYYRTDPNGRYSQQGGYDPDQGPYGNDRYGYGRNQDSIVGRVLADLNVAASNARLDGHERKHFDDAIRQLEQFEDRWAQGRFDSGKLHEAIEDLEHLANADRVRRPDREILARDIEDLRRFRSARGRYSDDRGYFGDRYNENWRYDPYWR